MKKNISKEDIIDVALELMKNRNDIRGINLREIARTLGCAHTNLYNYFPSLNDLLWASHIEIQIKFTEILNQNILQTDENELKLQRFFKAFLDIYLDNKGWFRLAWIEYIGDDRPKDDIIATEQTTETLIDTVSTIWEQLYHSRPDKHHVQRVLHNTHCYIIGEVSNYIAGRGLEQDEEALKDYVVKQAVTIFTLCLKEER